MNKEVLTTIGALTYGKIASFQGAKFMNMPKTAYDVLTSVADEGFYPEEATEEWCDILYLDGEFFAVFSDGAISSGSEAMYIQIQPNEHMLGLIEE